MSPTYNEVLESEATVTAMAKEMPEEIRLFLRLFYDCLRCSSEVLNGGDEYHRRNFVRGALAFIEGITYILQQYSLKLLASRPDLYSASEVSILREEMYNVSGGQVTTRTKIIPPDENFHFSITMLMRSVRPDFKLDTSGAQWSAFKEAIRIRNRITHPRQMSDLNLLDGEIEAAMIAWAWVLSLVLDCGMEFIVAKEKELGIPGQYSENPVLVLMKAAFAQLVPYLKSGTRP